jgi:four helix bundle protein
MTSYKTLEAWKKSMQLVKKIYLIVKSYPVEELYGLSVQTRRAVISVPCNIAEGLGRNHKKETIQFLHIARGSLYEVETLMSIAVMLNLLGEIKFAEMSKLSDECIKILNGLISYFEKNKRNSKILSS